MEKELRLYKDLDVLRNPTVKDSVYFVYNSATQKVTQVWVTTNQNVPKKVELNLPVKTATSPDGTIEIVETSTETQLEIEASLLAKINSALQPGDVTQYTDEQAQDAVGDILTDTSTIGFTYNDVGTAISADVKPNSITTAQLADTINVSEFINDAGYTTTTYVDGKIIDSIIDGDIIHAPSGNVVFDALASKVPTARTININGVTQDLSTDRQWRAGLSNTGALTYAGISVASATQVNIGAITGIITNNETTPGTPSYVLVTYAGGTNITVPTIGSGTGTYVLLKSNGTLEFQNTFPTSSQRKAMIYLSKISHPNLSSISFAIDEPDYVTSPLQQHRDLFQAIQYMNQGVIASGNAGLTINTSNGIILGDGINFVADKTNPNSVAIPAGAPRNFLLLNQSGAVGSFVTAIDPLNIDVAGVTTPIGGGTNRSSIQYLYYAPGVGFAIQRGQTIYSSLTDAVTALGRESFIIRPNLVNNSILIAAICLRHTTTDMNDTAFCRILPADKFGQIGGAAAGVSVTSLQTAYNNSLVPQITVTDALGAVTERSARALDTSTIHEWQNIAGITTASVDGNGLIKSGSTTLNDNPPVANNDLVRKDYLREELSYACSDETSDLTVGTLITFRMPFGLTLTNVKLSLNTAPTVSKVIVDIKKGGVSIFSTLISVDTSSTTSVGASVPAVISDSNLVDDSIITIHTTQIGSGIAGKGLKVTFLGRRI